jgi:hypothetical protein
MRWRPSSRPPAGEAEEEGSLLVDPTSELLEQVGEIESRVPWIPLGLVLIVLLWLPSLGQLAGAPPVPAETAWAEEVMTPWDPAGAGSAFARLLSRATWEWQGLEVEPGGELTAAQWGSARLPSALASLVGLVVFYLLARLVVGSAAGLLAATLLTTCTPWIRAGTTTMPLLIGEVLVLFGVIWAVHLQARHREVEIARVSASRIGLAGVLLGIGLLLMPAAFATFLTTLLVWLFLGLRRSSSDATTLPVESPGTNSFLAVFGSIVLLGSALIAAWAAERFAGGSGFPLAILFDADVARGVGLWSDLYRMLLSPGPTTDWLVIAALPTIFAIRFAEWWAGRPWQAAGLLPWLFLGAWFLALRRDGIEPGLLEMPITIAPLFLLGFGWLILRGLHPGRVRRQEYTFLVVWLVMGVLYVPFVSAGFRHDALLAATVGLMPAVLLTVGRAGRSLWESEEPPLARLAVFAIGYLPVIVFGVARAADLASGSTPLRRVSDLVQGNLIEILLGAVVLGILSEFFMVRPDLGAPVKSADDRPKNRRRGRRGGRRRRTPGGTRTGGSRAGGRGTTRRGRGAS